MTSPLARLLSSLANVVLDLGLPTIRGWLRDRLGPDADVNEVTTDGGTITLSDVRLPLGARGLVLLRRATATITSLGDEGPPLCLESFEGVLVFTSPELKDAFARADDANAYVLNPTFRADISFAAGEDPDPSAWIWGDLRIERAFWTTENPGAPLTGRARLFVSSRDYRLEGGRLDGAPSTTPDGKPPAVMRFAAAGSLEPGPPTDAVVPGTVASLALSLENGRVGPFLDAMTALAGADSVRAHVPDAVPRDTHLAGELSWSAREGARIEVRLDAATLGATLAGRLAFAPNGSALEGRLEGAVALAPLLRRLEAPSLAIPREEDVVRFRITPSGHVREARARIEMEASGIGLRLGRPRFVPAVVLQDLAGLLAFEGGRVSGRITGDARGAVVVDVDLGRTHRRVVVEAPMLRAPLLREIAATFARAVNVADDASTSLSLTYDGGALRGKVGLRTGRSSLELALGPTMRLTGGIACEDALATGLVENGTLYPTQGDVVVALDVDHDGRATGQLAAAGPLTLRVGSRDLHYRVSGARAEVVLGRTELRYANLRFEGYGGRFHGEGTVPFGRRAPGAPPYLRLTLEEGGAELARALFLLLREPRPELVVPEPLWATGELVIAERLGVEVALTTPAGTELAVTVDASRATAKGVLAVTDGLLVARAALPIEGLVTVEAERQDGITRVVLSSARVAYPPLVLEDASVLVLVEPNGDVLWNRLDARLGDGRVTSFGVVQRGGDVLARVSAAAVAVQALPPVEGRTLGSYVRGRASGSVVGHRTPRGLIEAHGDVVLDEAAFPVIDRARPALARYGLRPPNEDATGPAVASFFVDAEGLHLREVAVELHGANVHGRLDLAPGRVLDGHVEIVLEEEYLRTSKLLTLPRVLGDRLVIPIGVHGTTKAPNVHAELGQTLGQFLRESRVADFISSAVEEAQLFFTSNKRRTMTPPKPVAAPRPKPDWEAELRRRIDARAGDWETLASVRAHR